MNNLYNKHIQHKTWSIFRPEIDLYPVIIDNRSTIDPKNIFEIGAHNGSDSEYLRTCYNIDSSNVFCFEPNPNTFKELTEKYPNINAIQMAVSNENGELEFRCVHSDPGVSSLRRKIHIPEEDGDKVTVPIIRMDYVIEQYGIDSIDICKIDVEGCGYEVLEGFGNKLSIVKSIQIESETIPLFEGQKLFGDIARFLLDRRFYMASFFGLGSQCDTIWIREDLFKV
jgi:FkbM family methyltransferase